MIMTEPMIQELETLSANNKSLPAYSNYVTLISQNITDVDVDLLLRMSLGEKRKDLTSVAFLTLVYSVIFITGIIGNLSTCIVIGRNAYMHTATNYYLLNLAISDVLTLVLALPPEVYSIWEAYPWRFGEPFCILKSFIMEMTSYSSVLTITGFTIERYVAICHPIKVQKICGETRAIRCIVIIWFLASLSALPYPIHTRVFPYIINPKDGRAIKESVVCNIPLKWLKRMLIVFQISTFVYFVLPMIIITVLYVLIGLKLRPKELSAKDSENPQYGKTAATRARRAVLKMLVAVVVAFFVCWAPFHAQRLMTLYVKEWTPELLELQSHLFYVSGVLYFLSSTINPILYNLLSRKFRQAFKRTLCRCCINLNRLPTFYKLRAKFININEQGTTSPSGGRYLYPEKDIRMQTLLKPDMSKLHYHSKTLIDHPSTKDSDIKPSSSVSAYSSHAHSDGRLHYICRYKRCSSRRQSQLSKRNDNIVSYQDIEMLRKGSFGEKGQLLSTYGTSLGSLHTPALNKTMQII